MVDWRYTSDMGLRQSANGADFGETPALDYKQSLTTRMAKVAVDENWILSGVVSLAFTGVPAMTLRQIGKKPTRMPERRFSSRNWGNCCERKVRSNLRIHRTGTERSHR